MIELDDVKKAFNQGRPNEFWAIRGVSLKMDANRITVLKGPSGSGKTTLLSMIGCLSRPTSGRILLRSRILSGLPERFLTEIRRKTFGFIFQQFNLVKGLTVLENVMLPAYPLGLDHRQLRETALKLLRQFNMDPKADSKVEWLSGGEAQRTAICRALINDPEILIADEPTANLDTRLSREFMVIIRDLKQQGKTVIVTSHDPVVFEYAEIDTVVEMRDGILAEA
ncbi:ABC transporter ATP-binding protein [Thioalbus denitrificans]|uniref:Putative ABC transport system ATP-binding protein n=1 Tax=Thioalbus denitrificans TaxID=547122 RepID=A0A369CLJ9_9GAMM|nr:ABC transporter ATP-binding protein [Thioalbus denitrificans]RCX33307.1 putative ABC transport system ATP-binding protein [Thioalbus denitrificans]